MAKSKKPSRPREATKPAIASKAAPAAQSHAFRETVESIVIAFVLAFLFRTFEAEAFVIPTGSMAPTLMGRHKDVDCPKCGYRYQVSASDEEPDRPIPPSEILAGMCPMCHYVLPMRSDLLPIGVPERNLPKIAMQPSYNGDRILVNKYLYTFSDPKRWDVVVFKFPGNAQINFIKRLVGLPGETLRIYQGDLFARSADWPPGESFEHFEIERKPADKVLAMRQLVHDTDYDSAELDAAGWPLRWHTQQDATGSWETKKSVKGLNVRQQYSIDAAAGDARWLRYEHLLPDYDIWQRVSRAHADEASQTKPLFSESERSARRQLITDANPYDEKADRNNMYSLTSLDISPLKQGVHWVGDLMVEATLEIEEARGELLLDLVKGGKHFSCAIDVSNGDAKLSIPGNDERGATAKTPVRGAGKHRVAFANFDEQLLLWVDGKLVSFDGATTYSGEQVFGKRADIIPQTSMDDLGDLSPVGIGARNSKLAVTRLRVWRDIYYIADSSRSLNRFDNLISDFDPAVVDHQTQAELARSPKNWNLYTKRRHQDFPLGSDQFFVMGDNSAESSDARLWADESRPDRDRLPHPGGAYLERRMLIGKALCVYWPHSWNRIPGTPIPFPLFPNVVDMRLVR